MDILLQQIAESYLLSHASPSKLTQPWIAEFNIPLETCIRFFCEMSFFG